MIDRKIEPNTKMEKRFKSINLNSSASKIVSPTAPTVIVRTVNFGSTEDSRLCQGVTNTTAKNNPKSNVLSTNFVFLFITAVKYHKAV